MICKEKWKRALGALIAALSLGAVSLPATAAAAPKYPDLLTLPITDLRLGNTLVGYENHYVVRFSNTVANAGPGTFELHGTPHFPIDGLFNADQWVYGDPAGLDIKPVGTFAFHPSHEHFHFDGFARYELWKKLDFDRAQAGGFTTGKPIHTSPKVSFCVLDIDRYDANVGVPVGFYSTCSPAMEGISPGWADVYNVYLPEQWVDVGQKPLPDGNYVVRSIADPGNLIYESDGKANPARESQVANSAYQYFRIVNGRISATP